MRVKGFEPCFGKNCDTLILGSFPSVKSRETDFYYGHPRNRFWGTLAEYFGCPLPVTTEEKKALLFSHGIALWDVVTECEIKGSEDASIRDYSVADVTSFVKEHAVTRIFVNGAQVGDLMASAVKRPDGGNVQLVVMNVDNFFGKADGVVAENERLGFRRGARIRMRGRHCAAEHHARIRKKLSPPGLRSVRNIAALRVKDVVVRRHGTGEGGDR